jgi:hypothetical protein
VSTIPVPVTVASTPTTIAHLRETAITTVSGSPHVATAPAPVLIPSSTVPAETTTTLYCAANGACQTASGTWQNLPGCYYPNPAAPAGNGYHEYPTTSGQAPSNTPCDDIPYPNAQHLS